MENKHKMDALNLVLVYLMAPCQLYML